MFNQITLVGTLMRDAELRYTNSGAPVTDFFTVVTERWGDEASGAQERETRFRVTAWGRTAENSAPFLTEGRRVVVMGRIDGVSAWMDENGDPHARIEVVARRIVPVADEAEDQDFQSVVVAGNLGRDPELRYTPDGTAVADFSMAVNEYWRDGETGETQEKTIWFRISVWRRQAETAAQYLAKGRKALITGRMDEPGAWIGQSGEARGSLDVTATRVQFMDSRRDAEAGGSQLATYSGGPPAIDDEDEIPF
jgi:single-strand DNA-binding protein